MTMNQTSLKMVTYISGNRRMANPQVLGNTNGQMVTHTQENSCLAKSMVKENGERNLWTRVKQTNSIRMMDIMKWVKNMGMANSSGNRETNTQEIITRIKDKAMAPWNGPITVSIKAIGLEVFSMASVSWRFPTVKGKQGSLIIIFLKCRSRPKSKLLA